MLNFENCTIAKCIVHWVGNNYVGDKSQYSKSEIHFNENESVEIKNIFLKHFKSPTKASQFYHSINLSQNTIYKVVEDIFDSSKNFVKDSKNIVKYLFEQSTHHSIKSGELYIIKFQEVHFNDIISDAIGIFKVESPTSFIKSYYEEDSISFFLDKGVIGKNIEKGCIIFNNDYHNGYIVYNYEKNSTDTNYWTKDFLSLKIREDNFNKTNHLLDSYREFILTDLPGDSYSKKEKIELINKSIDYLATDKATISIDNFIKSNIPDKRNQKEYVGFLDKYCEENDVTFSDSFESSFDAVKYQKRKFKNVIKLDKNFHIYIHGDENLIENGVDKNGKKFYKIYYDNEQ